MQSRGGSDFSCSNCLLVTFNILNLFCAVILLWAAVGLAKGPSQCEASFAKPFIAVAVILLITSIVGLVGSCFHFPKVLIAYLCILALLIVLLVAVTVFVSAVTRRGAGDEIPGKKYEEYRLGRYSNWLERRVNKTKTWQKIKSCLEAARVCSDLTKNYANITEIRFYNWKLSPIQSGCCKPSNDCGFGYVHPAQWNITGGDYKNADCLLWENKPNVLCFNCNSCKAGLLNQVKRQGGYMVSIGLTILVWLAAALLITGYAIKRMGPD